MKNFKEITIREAASIYLNNLKEKTLLIYSPTSMSKIQFENVNIDAIDTGILTKSKEKLDIFSSNNINTYKKVVGLGGGTATDIAKYISYKINCQLTVIPAMLSTNAYATNKVALIDNAKKKTFDAKLPDCIVLDIDLIKQASKQNLYGFADIFSIYTALKDWNISNNDTNEKIDLNIYNKANRLLNSAINFVKNNSLASFNNSIETLYEIIGESGEITNIYGSGRPESGSEHIFAKALEEIVAVPHGISVSIGILLMSSLQNNYSEEILYCINKLHVLEDAHKYGINIDLVQKVFNSLIPRIDRYTVISTDIYNKNNCNNSINVLKDLI